VLHGIHFRVTPLISRVPRSGTKGEKEVGGLTCGDIDMWGYKEKEGRESGVGESLGKKPLSPSKSSPL